MATDDDVLADCRRPEREQVVAGALDPGAECERGQRAGLAERRGRIGELGGGLEVERGGFGAPIERPGAKGSRLIAPTLGAAGAGDFDRGQNGWMVPGPPRARSLPALETRTRRH